MFEGGDKPTPEQSRPSNADIPAPPAPPEPEDILPPWEQFTNAEPPTFDRDETYQNMIDDMAIRDPFAMDLLWQGWFNDDIDTDERVEAREMFFDYTGMGTYDFDWDQWREWYGEAA